MRTDDMADLAVPTDEYPTPNSKILVRNSMGWSKDIEMWSICLAYLHLDFSNLLWVYMSHLGFVL